MDTESTVPGTTPPAVSEFGSVDPAPAVNGEALDGLVARLIDEERPMFQRMRAVFALRNRGGEAAVQALARAFEAPSALLRHEVAYVMGQMQDAAAIPFLVARLEDEAEHVMVRHEAAEALGAIGATSARPVLERFASHPAPEVAESCEVALDLLDWVTSESFEYGTA